MDMKIVLLILLMVLGVSCTYESDRYIKKFEMVDITKMLIPGRANSLDNMQISAEAQANNGCWSNLYFELKKTKEFEYTLKAYGTFESFGACPERLVTKDTVVNFQPSEKGTYLFHISRNPNEADIHTVVVE
jgi:hypothetical protein